MKKVYQSRVGKNGNCLSACIASLLEMQLKYLPKIDNSNYKNWINAYQLFLNPMNLGMTLSDFDHSPKGWAIGVFGTGKKYDHAVVCYNGRKRHDPTPKKYRERARRLKDLKYWIVLTVLDPLKPIKITQKIV